MTGNGVDGRGHGLTRRDIPFVRKDWWKNTKNLRQGVDVDKSEWPSHDKRVVRYLNQVNAVKRNKPHSCILGKWGLSEGHGHEQIWRWPAMVHHEHRDLLQRLVTPLSRLWCAFMWPAYRKTAVRRWFDQNPLLCERPPDPLRDERAPWICSDELAAG